MKNLIASKAAKDFGLGQKAAVLELMIAKALAPKE